MIDGRGVVFLHGAGTTGSIWQLQSFAFPQALTPDLPGRDGRETPRTVSAHVSALRPALAQARVLVGHSLGGAVALEYALESASHLAGLVLLGTGARLEVAAAWRRRLEEGPAALAEFAERFFAPQTPPRLKQKSLELLQAMDPDVVRADLEAAEGFDVRDRLGGVILPVLVLSGAEDRVTPPRYAEFLHAHLPRAALVWIEEAGHLAMLEQPQAVNRSIRDFLTQVGA